MFSFYLLVLVSFSPRFSSGTCFSQYWEYYNNACYYGLTGIPTYSQSKQTCTMMGTNVTVVTIHSQDEQNFLNTKYPSWKYWIGLENYGGNWISVDGVPVNYTNWATTAPTTGCVMADGLGKWIGMDCMTKNAGNQATVCKYNVGTTATTVTANATATTTGMSTSACADLTDATGKTNCPQLVGLCNDPNYSALMAVQCPLTCGYCTSPGAGTTGTGATCVDRTDANGVTDCPQKAYLCNNTVFYDFMTQECPKTCNRCLSTSVTTSGTAATTSPCVDRIPAGSTTTNCPQLVNLCNDPAYAPIMARECPRTCGLC